MGPGFEFCVIFHALFMNVCLFQDKMNNILIRILLILLQYVILYVELQNCTFAEILYHIVNLC